MQLGEKIGSAVGDWLAEWDAFWSNKSSSNSMLLVASPRPLESLEVVLLKRRGITRQP